MTNQAGVPHAVLVRAALPHTGLPVLLSRRRLQAAGPRLMPGPGTVSQALAITTALTRASLRGNTVWIEDAGLTPAAADIDSSPRIGVDYAAEDAARPYRFVWTQPAVRP